MSSGLTRRRFLAASLTASGGLLLSFRLPALGRAPASVEVDGEGAEINAWLAIEPDGSVVIRVAQSDMGQGVFTAMPMIVAEELEADWSQVSAEYASANRQLREDGVYQRMATGGSRAVRHSRPYLQRAGAEARERLRHAAAQRWQVDAASCEARSGRIHHARSGRSLGYGELAAAAATVSLPQGAVAIKSPDQFRLLGTPTRRLDVPAKVDGSAVFGSDVRLPGMVYAAVAHCPVIGGELDGHDFAAIQARPGIIAAVPLPGAIAVVADGYWPAQQALEALPVRWKPGAGAGGDSVRWRQAFRAALDQSGVVAAGDRGALAAIDAASRQVEADYDVPYLAHACMEPMNCTARIDAGRAEVWIGVQNPDAVLQVVAEESGVAPAHCHVHSCHLGGGFGRRAQPDVVREAVRIARAVGRPVQLIWSREQDMRAGWYRPMAAFRFRAGLDDAGRVAGFYNHSVTHSIMAPMGAAKGGIDGTSVQGLSDSPYAFGQRLIEHTIRNTHLSAWFWRSVGYSQNAWAMESFIDELAGAAGRDPLELRRELLAGRGDFLRVLDVLAGKAGWGRTLPPGSAQGLAIVESYGTIVGQVAEVTVSKAGALRLDRVVSVVDCGHTVNPLSIEEQIESGIVYGLSAALYGKLTVVDGAVQEGNFDRYPVLRLRDTPVMETHLALSGGDKWGGIGEPGLPPAAPAVCNAVFRVTGRRIRSLPLADHDLSWG